MGERVTENVRRQHESGSQEFAPDTASVESALPPTPDSLISDRENWEANLKEIVKHVEHQRQMEKLREEQEANQLEGMRAQIAPEEQPENEARDDDDSDILSPGSARSPGVAQSGSARPTSRKSMSRKSLFATPPAMQATDTFGFARSMKA